MAPQPPILDGREGGAGSGASPATTVGTVLVTGASGYIGGRLIQQLLELGYSARAMVRAPSAEHVERWPNAEIVVADADDPASLDAALAGVDVAYYLIHSMLQGSDTFPQQEALHARNFREAAERNGVRRVIYLGGLGDVRTQLSPHLASRMRVAEELQAGSVPATILRAAIIIGAGSASYEILHHLVRRLPIIPIPKWGRTRCQPICVRDVIRYLTGVLETPETAGQSYDIGGREVVTYEELLKTCADILGKHRVFVPCFLSHVPTVAYITGLLTPVPAPITRSLMGSLLNDVVCQNDDIRQVIPFETSSIREAIVDALTVEEQDEVSTRWTDAYPPAHELAIKIGELEEPPRYSAMATLLTTRSAEALFRSVCRIGGKEGWFRGNWMWRLRGMFDNLLMGAGTSRGRRSASTLRVDDVVDFWRVEDIRRNSLLLLRAEMKLPGKAWLEFRISRRFGWNRLSVTAYYATHTLFGKLYWYCFMPFHHYIFNHLISQIEKRS